MSDEKTQAEKFAGLAREVEADPDEEAWDERRKIAAPKPVPEHRG